MQTGQSPDRGPSWAVVMTVCEPLALVLTNVRWHLATGAAAVFVFVDDPDDPAAAALGAEPGCHVQICDGPYWRDTVGRAARPASQMRRQTINANIAQDRCAADWLFHVDADEFILQTGDLRAELATQAAGGVEVNLPAYERLFPHPGPQADLFDGAFRATAPDGIDARAAYGPFESFMKRGQYSHGAGKSGVPVGGRFRLGVHNATIRGTKPARRAPKHVSQTARLLHFDGLTPLHWVMKAVRYRLTPPKVQQAILQPHRAAQIDWMVERGETLATALGAHRDLFALTPERRAQLDAFGLLQEARFDPRRVLGAAVPDLSVAAFDAELHARNPWFAPMMRSGR